MLAELEDDPLLESSLRLLLVLDRDEESSLPPPSPPLRPERLVFDGLSFASFDLDFDRLLWAMLWVMELWLALEFPDPSVSQSDLDSLSDECRDNSSDSESLPKILRAVILRSWALLMPSFLPLSVFVSFGNLDLASADLDALVLLLLAPVLVS